MTQSVRTVFILKPELYDPRFTGWVFSRGAKSVLGDDNPSCDFTPERAAFLDWEPKKLQKMWTPPHVTGDVKSFNDYPCLELKTPAFSAKAVNVIGQLLSDNGELLQLDSPTGTYYAYNCLRKVDALNVGKSRFDSLGPGKRALAIEYFEFHKSKVEHESIFRIPQQPNIHLVTDKFKTRVEDSGLNGFVFIKVWPLVPGTNWEIEEAIRRKKCKKVQLVGQALILRLRLKKDSPSSRERKMVEQILESLASKLVVESIDHRYWGTLEVSEFEDGEFRIFCSCPNCDELAEYLSDWVENVPWEHDFAVVKRYGNLYDQKAKETRILIR